MPNDIRIEKIISARILGQLGPNLDRKILFGGFPALLDVRHCLKLQSCAVYRKTNDANLKCKNLIFFRVLLQLDRHFQVIILGNLKENY